MNIGNGFRRKLRHGSASLGITALVIAGVILLNIAVSALCSGNLWFIDTTSEEMYQLTDDAKHLMATTINNVNSKRPADDPVRVEIIFCADPDMICRTELMRYVYYTALNFEKSFPDTVHVTTTDVWKNPSSVDAYRTTSYSSIYQSSVIVSSGTEFRIYNLDSFYVLDTDENETPWAYQGEKTFLNGIIAVTRAESPICALTVNHGEPFATEEGRAQYSELLKVIEAAGYDCVFLNLETDPIPEDCRLIITFDPQTDFASDFLGTSTVSEVSKLDDFLGKAYSFMVFADAQTPKLPALEEYLEEWGIAFSRYTTSGGDEATYELIDPEYAVDNAGATIIGQYQTGGFGGSLTKNIRERGASPKVLFGNAMSLAYSPTYQFTYVLANEEYQTDAYTYAKYNGNGYGREAYSVFHTGKTAYAHANLNGERLVDDSGNALIADTAGSFQLMALSRQNRTIGEGQGYTSVNNVSYVCAVASTDFASNEVLSSNAYGNTDVLLATLRAIGKEVVPVGVGFNVLYESEIGTSFYTEAGATAYTVVLSLLPAFVLTFAGIYVLVRRKTRN